MPSRDDLVAVFERNRSNYVAFYNTLMKLNH